MCNMAAEFGAMTAFIAPDEVVFDYLKGRRYAPSGTAWDGALFAWRALATEPGAEFDHEIAIDAGRITPMVSRGVSPQQSVAITAAVPTIPDPPEAGSQERALDYMAMAPAQRLIGTPIDAAFIGSCTNSRIARPETVAASALTGSIADPRDWPPLGGVAEYSREFVDGLEAN